MKNIHVIPTDKPSRLLYNYLLTSFSVQKESNGMYVNDGKVSGADFWGIEKAINNGFKPHNIYITSDEEIKVGDWYYLPRTNSVHKCIEATELNLERRLGVAKIILTTDQDLIKDGVQAIDDEFLEWFVKNPSFEMVVVSKICQKETISEWWGDLSDKEMEEVFKQTGNFRLGGWGHDIGPTEEDVKDMYLEVHNLDLKELNFNVYYKIIFPQEEPKQVDSETRQETLEEAALNIIPDRNIVGWVDSYSATERRGFIKGDKYQAERMYSHEQVLTILEQFIEHPTKPGYKRSDVVDFIKKFKQQDK
jgi:hypothetical protein